jgi:hypothetical protein
VRLPSSSRCVALASLRFARRFRRGIALCDGQDFRYEKRTPDAPSLVKGHWLIDDGSMLFGMPLDVIGIIGIVLLIGIVKKNGIMCWSTLRWSASARAMRCY